MNFRRIMRTDMMSRSHGNNVKHSFIVVCGYSKLKKRPAIWQARTQSIEIINSRIRFATSGWDTCLQSSLGVAI
jgi:hypothetical protein